MLAGISAAIAAIPEEPPVLLAVVLGLGAYRLLRRGVLVRRLNAQETLGSVDLIVTDKTGTLTENRLTLETIVTPTGSIDDPAMRRSLVLDALRAEEDAWGTAAGIRFGSFTRALLGAGGSADNPCLDSADLLEVRPPVDGQPYSMTRAMRDGLVEELALGAPEAVLDLCGNLESRNRWEATIEATANAGRRLLLLASRVGDATWRPRAIFAFTDTLRVGDPRSPQERDGSGHSDRRRHRGPSDDGSHDRSGGRTGR